MTMTVQPATGMSERDHQARLDREGWPCACDDRAPCLGHYGMQDNRDRARVRRTIGISDFEGRRY